MARFGSKYTLPFDAWPEVDKRFWNRHFLRSLSKVSHSRGRVLRPVSVQHCLCGYSSWLAFLRDGGLLDEEVDPRRRATPKAIHRYVESLLGRVSARTASIAVWRLWTIFRSTDNDRRWSWLREIERGLRCASRKPSVVKVPSCAPADLFAAGIRLMESADRGSSTFSAGAAVKYRDGLIIALLALRPIRLTNLRNIRIGHQLIWNAGAAWLHFGASEMKAGRPMQFPIPEPLLPRLRRYLQAVRPWLLGSARHDHLWVSIRHHPLALGAICNLVADRTLDAVGLRVPPQQFRHVAATWQASADPVNAEAGRFLLGHSDFRTTERYYVGTSTRLGGDKLQDTIQHYRREGAAIQVQLQWPKPRSEFGWPPLLPPPWKGFTSLTKPRK
jgi:integrase/recombinase XerD